MDLREPRALDAWRPLHDGVMGGVSSGSAAATADGARFDGRLSLENNGGFASFRAEVAWPDLGESDGLRLRVRGDGRVYKLDLRVDGEWEGVGWQAPFHARAGEWATVDLAFEDLVPTWRGRLVTRAEPFDATRIVQVGVVLADGREGPFELELASLAGWRDAGAPAEGTRAAARRRTAEVAAALDGDATGGDVAADLRGRERLLVVATPGELDARATRQIGWLLARPDDLAGRELRVVQLLGTRGGRVAGRTLTAGGVRELREAWNLRIPEWAVALVGKDGGVKHLWAAPVDPDELFSRIDAMPMRRAEAAARRDDL